MTITILVPMVILWTLSMVTFQLVGMNSEPNDPVSMLCLAFTILYASLVGVTGARECTRAVLHEQHPLQ